MGWSCPKLNITLSQLWLVYCSKSEWEVAKVEGGVGGYRDDAGGECRDDGGSCWAKGWDVDK